MPKNYLQELSAKREFRENWIGNRHTLREEMHLYPPFPYLLTDLGKFRYKAVKNF